MTNNQNTKVSKELEKSADILWEELTGGRPVQTDPVDEDYWFKQQTATLPEKEKTIR